MSEKRKNPYQMLLDDVKGFCRKLQYRHTTSMFVYPKANQDVAYRLDNLYQRVAAAEQLGYDVVLSADNDGLRVKYRKKEPEIPSRWQ